MSTAWRAPHAARRLSAAINRQVCRWSPDAAAGLWRTGCGVLTSRQASTRPAGTCSVCSRVVLPPQGLRNKYGATRTTVEGRAFDSKREARRYAALRSLERAGAIVRLECQVPYVLHAVNLATGELTVTGRYVADFRYQWAASGLIAVEDAKGFKTPVYKLKKRHVEAEYGITILES